MNERRDYHFESTGRRADGSPAIQVGGTVGKPTVFGRYRIYSRRHPIWAISGHLLAFGTGVVLTAFIPWYWSLLIGSSVYLLGVLVPVWFTRWNES